MKLNALQIKHSLVYLQDLIPTLISVFASYFIPAKVGIKSCIDMLKNALFVHAFGLNHSSKLYAKQKHLGCKKGEANQNQQLSDYRCIRT